MSELDRGGFSVRVLAIDQVIASKEELGRPKDQASLPAAVRPAPPAPSSHPQSSTATKTSA